MSHFENETQRTLAGYCGRLLLTMLLAGTALVAHASAQEDRWKADLLLVVAHPDDETPIGSYLARAIYDQHKRVAVVFGTGGGSGGNAEGPGQSRALAEMREVEARKALAHFGVMNVFFLHGIDTPGQDVLRSLENWNHGDQLDRVVRVVRLTRPEVIVTWLPAVLIGENHGDHQAAAVLATEAFDTAGDPTVFPEQVAAPRDREGMNNLLEGLHPWQPQKLYFYSDTSHPDTLAGKGPTYLATEISPARGVSYARLATEEGSEHITQGDSGGFAQQALLSGKYGYFADPVRFILGKTLLPSGVTDDVFKGVQPSGIGFHSAPGYQSPAFRGVSLQFEGPWLFYDRFWPAHGLGDLATFGSPELLVNLESPVTVPVIINNSTDDEIKPEVHVQLPDGWVFWRRPPQTITVAPRNSQTFTFEARTPAKAVASENAIVVEATGATTIRLRLSVRHNAMPQ